MTSTSHRSHRSARRTAAVALSVLALFTAAACGADSGADSGGPPSSGPPSSGPVVTEPDFRREAGIDKTAVLSPVAFRALAPVAPVIGSDGQRHYAYELTVVNQSPGTARLLAIQAETPNRVDVGQELFRDSLNENVRVNGTGAENATLRPGGSGTVFLDLATDPAAPVPTSLEHKIDVSYTPPRTGRKRPRAQELRLIGVPVAVDPVAPTVVSPPVRGAGWVVGNGCCSPINAHRGSTLAINGAASVAQRFAVDLVQLSDDGAAVTGNPAKRASYPAYGKTVHAAAAGTVVGRRDGEKEQRPGALPAGATIQTADGNYLVVDIGNGRFAFYAHLQPGSVKPAIGDRVEVGAELGQLGNTGNTDAPHLHFHLMDGPSPLRSNGLPFVFDTFEGQGVVTDMGSLEQPEEGVTINVDRARRSGAHTDQMPLGADVVTFAGR